MTELIQQQIPDYAGNMLKGFQTGQQIRANQLQLLAADQEMDINKQKFAQTQAENILAQIASTGDKNALQRLAGLNPVRAEGIRKQQDYDDIQGARVLDAFDTLPQYARNQKRWEQMHDEYKVATGRELPLPANFPSERNDPAIAEFNALKTRLKGREQELKEQTDLSVQETGRGLMTFDKKTGEFKLAQTGGQNIPVYVKPPTSVVNIDNREESSFYKEFGKNRGEEYATLMKNSRNAAGNIAKLNRAEQLFDQIGDTGKLTPSMASLGNIANQLGIKVDKNKIANIEQLIALSKEQAGAILASGQYGAGTAISEADLAAAQSRVFSAQNSVAGAKLIIDTQRRLDMRSAEAGRLVNKMTGEKRPLDQIETTLQDLASKPLFPEEGRGAARTIKTQKPISEMSTEELMMLRNK